MNDQIKLCNRYGAPFCDTPDTLILGVAVNVRSGMQPINGLRHPSQGGASGWYVWAGEDLSDADDFFQPLHISHVEEWCPGIHKYLGLPPGWRFLFDRHGYEDVWEDPSLLLVQLGRLLD